MAVEAGTTAQEFETICHRFDPSELVRGKIVRLEHATFTHGRIGISVMCKLGEWARRERRGRVVGGCLGIIVETNPDTVRGADAAYISYERLPTVAGNEGFCSVPPEIVVQIVGKGQGWNDMVKKAGEYLRMGVDRVWIVDPQSRRVHIFRPDSEPAVLDEDATLVDEAILPGFSCLAGEFFGD